MKKTPKKYPKGMCEDDYELWDYLQTPRALELIAKRVKGCGSTNRYELARHKMIIWRSRGWVSFIRGQGRIRKVVRILSEVKE